MLNLTVRLQKWLASSTPRQKLTAGVLAFGLLAAGGLLVLSDSAASSNAPGATPLYFIGVFIKLIGVLVLIVASSVIFRRWLQFGPNGKAVRNLRLLETIRLSPRQAVHLIGVGDQQFLIGATDQSVSLIAPIEGSLFPASALTTLGEIAQPQPGQDFGALLQSFGAPLSVEPIKGEAQHD